MAALFTQEYNVASRNYLGAITRGFLCRMWWLFIIPLGCIFAGIFDWRLIFLGLIILMLIYPVGITTALLSDAMRPEVVRRASSRKASFENSTVTLYRPVETPDTVTWEIIETVPYTEITYWGKMSRINVSSRTYDFILLPSDALPSQLILS